MTKGKEKPKVVKFLAVFEKNEKRKDQVVTWLDINEFIRVEERRYTIFDDEGVPVFKKSFKGI